MFGSIFTGSVFQKSIKVLALISIERVEEFSCEALWFWALLCREILMIYSVYL
jgi:hypothetical protein